MDNKMDKRELVEQKFIPIWRDETTGFPMHSHGIPYLDKSLNIYLYWLPDYGPCHCGNKAWDIPLSAVQAEDEKQ